MRHDPYSTAGILDEAVRAVVRVAPPWVGVLWLTEAPLRLLQVSYFLQAGQLGPAVADHVTLLQRLALLQGLLFLVSLPGRLIFLRAVQLFLETGQPPGREALRVPLGSLLGYAVVALALELLFVGLGWLLLPAPLLLLLAGLAAATAHRQARPALLAPWRELGRALKSPPVLFGLPLTFLVATVLTWLNLNVLLGVGLWLAQGLSGEPLATWEVLLRPLLPGIPVSPAEPHVALLVGVATMLVVEPFWLASLLVAVRQRQAGSSGEDLRRWFWRLRQEEETRTAAPRPSPRRPAGGARPHAGRGSTLGLLLLLLSPVARADLPPLTLAGYREQLDALEAAGQREDQAEVRKLAGLLRTRRVAHAGAEAGVDTSLLDALAAADSPAARAGSRARLQRLREALARDEHGGAGPAAGADPVLLQRLQDEQATAELLLGGTLDPPRIPDMGLSAWILDGLQSLATKLLEPLAQLWEWLVEKLQALLRGRETAPQRPGETPRVFVVALLLTLLAAAVALGIAFWRQRGRREAVPGGRATPGRSRAGDEEVLARSAAGWEAHARELARTGRYREAVRAWVHAVLVELFGRGLLRPRQDWTNWELVRALAPEHRWRPDFIELVSRFDRIWYGMAPCSPEEERAQAAAARRILGRLGGAGSPGPGAGP